MSGSSRIGADRQPRGRGDAGQGRRGRRTSVHRSRSMSSDSAMSMPAALPAVDEGVRASRRRVRRMTEAHQRRTCWCGESRRARRSRSRSARCRARRGPCRGSGSMPLDAVDAVLQRDHARLRRRSAGFSCARPSRVSHSLTANSTTSHRRDAVGGVGDGGLRQMQIAEDALDPQPIFPDRFEMGAARKEQRPRGRLRRAARRNSRRRRPPPSPQCASILRVTPPLTCSRARASGTDTCRCRG